MPNIIDEKSKNNFKLLICTNDENKCHIIF